VILRVIRYLEAERDHGTGTNPVEEGSQLVPLIFELGVAGLLNIDSPPISRFFDQELKENVSHV
jgi:hypothetical protein